MGFGLVGLDDYTVAVVQNTTFGNLLIVSLFVFCLFIAVDEAAPYGVSEQTGLPRLLKTKPQEGSLKATDGGGQGPRRFPITASGGTIGGASP